MNDLFNISMQQAINEALTIQNNLHFIRAYWFYAFIPLFLLLYFSYKTRLNNKNWLGVIDLQLQPFVLSSTANKQRHYPLFLVLLHVVYVSPRLPDRYIKSCRNRFTGNSHH